MGNKPFLIPLPFVFFLQGSCLLNISRFIVRGVETGQNILYLGVFPRPMVPLDGPATALHRSYTHQLGDSSDR